MIKSPKVMINKIPTSMKNIFCIMKFFIKLTIVR